MATRLYSINPEDADYQVTEAAGSATVTKSIELTVDYDTLIGDGLSSSQVRLQVLAALEKMAAYIEQSGKANIGG